MAAPLRRPRLPRSMTDTGSAAWHPVPEARSAGLGPHFVAHAAIIEGRGERRDRKRHMTAASDVHEAQAGLQRARSQARTHTHTQTRHACTKSGRKAPGRTASPPVLTPASGGAANTFFSFRPRPSAGAATCSAARGSYVGHVHGAIIRPPHATSSDKRCTSLAMLSKSSSFTPHLPASLDAERSRHGPT
jgi:hypothetical protein